MASYSLQPTDYAIVKNNGTPFDDGSISVSLQGDKDSPRVHLFSGDSFIEVALEQWPLIIEAVDKLLNKGADKLVNVDAPLDLLRKMELLPWAVHDVLKGKIDTLDQAFYWTNSPQGDSYWRLRCSGKEPLSDNDRALLQSWLDAANHYGL